MKLSSSFPAYLLLLEPTGSDQLPVSQTGRLGRHIISGEEVSHVFIPADTVSEGDSQPLWKGPEMRTLGPDKGQETTAQAFRMWDMDHGREDRRKNDRVEPDHGIPAS